MPAREITRLPLAIAAALLPATLLAQNEPPAPVFLFEHTGLSTWLVDDKDAALGRALGMIPARIGELPAQVPGMPPEAASLADLALRTCARPTRVAVMADPDNPGGFGAMYGLLVSVHMPDEQEARSLEQTVNGLVAWAGMAPAQSRRHPTMRSIPTPFATVSFGPRQAADGWRYELHAGNIGNPDEAFASLAPPPEGFTPIMRASFNSAGLEPLVEMARAFAGGQPQVAELLHEVDEKGLIGPDGIGMDFRMGHTAEENFSVTTIRNARKIREMMWLAEGSLTAADLAAVPADAHAASLGKVEMDKLGEMLDDLREQGVPIDDALAEFRARTGVDPERDVLAALGDTFALYLSDSTGGGSLMSGVALLGVKDHARLSAAHTRLMTAANDMLARVVPQPGVVHVALSSWEYDGVSGVSLRFPGLPIPIEVSYALTDSWLVLSPSPQGVIAAVRQAQGRGDGGLTQNRAYASVAQPDHPLISITFVDNARLMHSGYALTSMLGSALGNMVRSPADPARDPGLIVPPFNDLKRGARPSVEFNYWLGDDLVTESRSDRSVLVNTCGSLGALAKAAPLVAGAVGAAVLGTQHGPRPMGARPRFSRRPNFEPLTPEEQAAIEEEFRRQEQERERLMQMPGWAENDH